MSKPYRLLLCLALVFALLGSGLLLWARLRESKGELSPVEHTTLYRAPGIQSASPSVLLLSHPGDGGRLLAKELTRRGIHVLLAEDASVIFDAWDYLAGNGFARLSSLCLMARGKDIPQALALSEALSGSGKEPAAVVLSGSDVSLAREAAGRDLLFLTGHTPDAAALADFYGDDTPAGVISGFFADGSARKVSALRSSVPRWGSRDTMLTVFDWLGSSLGHVIELPDTDMTVTADRALLSAGLGSLVAAAVCSITLWGLLKRRASRIHKEDP